MPLCLKMKALKNDSTSNRNKPNYSSKKPSFAMEIKIDTAFFLNVIVWSARSIIWKSVEQSVSLVIYISEEQRWPKLIYPHMCGKLKKQLNSWISYIKKERKEANKMLGFFLIVQIQIRCCTNLAVFIYQRASDMYMLGCRLFNDAHMWSCIGSVIMRLNGKSRQ